MNTKKRLLISICAAIFALCIVSASMFAADKTGNPIADINIGSHTVTWQPKVDYGRLLLTVSGPGNLFFTRTFEGTRAPYYQLTNPVDGQYTYELKVLPAMEWKGRSENEPGKNIAITAGSGAPFAEAITQTGYFHVKNGSFVTPKNAPEEMARTKDIVHADDVIIDGSLCVGNDCYSGLAFGFDTIVMMENNLRIFFDDTSTIQNYPRNDWRIVANDSTDGGGNYFAVQDATEVSNVLVLEAGAPDNSLYVDNHGDVGINTSTPYYELHIVDGDSPAVRLDQDGSYGWTPQKWDLCGNESNFFIRDATHASKLPFRIEPDAPTDSIFIKSSGNVGIGTGSPSEPLEIERTGTNAKIWVDRTDGATGQLTASASNVQIGAASNHPVRIVANGSYRMEIQQDGDIVMAVGGGTYDHASGDWLDGSSRDYKKNIAELKAETAMAAFNDLKPVTFQFKADKDNELKVGFIAEDVPDLVATRTRKNLSSMDIVAVLTKVMQEQQKTISKLQEKMAELEKKLSTK
jgi:hypothetical protein